MNTVLYYVKYITMIQLILIVVGIFFFTLLRIIFKINDRRILKKKSTITQLLDLLIRREIILSASIIKFFKKNLRELLNSIRTIEDIKPQEEHWSDIKQKLIELVLKPQARLLAKSSKWLKQYLAVMCYEYGTEREDYEFLVQLVQSNTLLISLNAARVIFKYPTTESINALIDSLTKSRHIQQSFFQEILIPTTDEPQTNKIIITTFINRLSCEQNPYIKAFCYRMLTRLVQLSDTATINESIILSENLELKIAELQYLSCLQNSNSREILKQSLTDPHFEVRAVTAKLLGDHNDNSVIPALEKTLGDPIWWVRINSAQSLAKLGDQGIRCLQNQSPEIDAFAYQTAQKILITLEKNWKK